MCDSLILFLVNAKPTNTTKKNIQKYSWVNRSGLSGEYANIFILLCMFLVILLTLLSITYILK